MKNSWLLCAFVVVQILNCNAQQNVLVNVYSYFDTFVRGTGTVTCRPAEELSLGGPNQLTCANRAYAIPPRSQGRWGTPHGDSQKSGLGFEGVLNRVVSLNTDFFLGSMTHFNFPILNGTAATGVTLNIIFSISTTQGQSIGTYLYNFPMLIDETFNVAPCLYPSPSDNPCSDKIFFTNSLNTNVSFTLGQVDYTLQLRGFKESNSSSSAPVQFFISNERRSSLAFLFARITAACPRTCVNGGDYVLSSSNGCVCDCTGVNCPFPAQVTTPNCTCVCPNPSACNNGAGGVLNPDCSCSCQDCGGVLLTNPADCSCSCPPNYCGVGTIANPNTCSCNCPSTPCPIPGEVRDGRCNCTCNLACPAPKIENPSAGICACMCPNTCPPGYTINNNDCTCQCTRNCVNAPLIASNCTCGPCVGNWTLAPNGTCTICALSPSSCGEGEGVDPGTCSCVCNNLQCNLFNGSVVDTTQYCKCRNCVAGECYCGNGIVEPGEQCDVIGDPCCVECKYTIAPCNDNNACTQSDTCNGTGHCIGEYKCPPSNECMNITCNTTIGTCDTHPFPDNTPCGPQPQNVCLRRCIAGVCVTQNVTCPADNDPDDCLTPTCDPLTGNCPYRPITDPNFLCSDDDLCTFNDKCTNGTCRGEPVTCPASEDPCKTYVCTDNFCTPVLLSGIPCNADDNACTVGDICVEGICQTGTLTTCSGGDQCKSPFCNVTSGVCEFLFLNTTCSDNNVCTMNDTCVSGVCFGIPDPSLEDAVECGGDPQITPAAVNNTSALIFGLVGAGALIGAIAGIAFLIKKIKDSKLLDPETWDPDKFSSIGSNPLYKGSEKTVDNRLYEGSM